DDAYIRRDVDKRLRIEVLGVDHGVVDVREDFEFVPDADVVAVRRDAVRDDAVAHLIVDEGIDHLMLARHPPNPVVRFDGHYLLCAGAPPPAPVPSRLTPLGIGSGRLPT